MDKGFAAMIRNIENSMGMILAKLRKLRNNSDHEIALRIHAAALKLLENPGVQLDHDGICGMLLKAGAKEGKSNNSIRFPEALINEKLALCPKEFVFADREGKGKIVSAFEEAEI